MQILGVEIQLFSIDNTLGQLLIRAFVNNHSRPFSVILKASYPDDEGVFFFILQEETSETVTETLEVVFIVEDSIHPVVQVRIKPLIH